VRQLLRVGPIAAAAALLLTGCIKIGVAESDIYTPQPGGVLTGEALGRRAPGYTLEPQTVRAADGTELVGVLLRRPGSERTILYFGGNGSTVEHRGPEVARRLAPLGADIMIIDYRGYGASGKTPPTVAGMKSDGLAVFDHLARLPGMSPSRIVVHGHSLGSFLAGYVAAERPTAGVVLESSATNAQDFGRSQVPLLARPLVRLNIQESLRAEGNLQQMSRLDEPLLILAGERDDTTPAWMSRALFRASTLPPERKRLVVLEDAGHNDVLLKPAALQAYAAFLATTRR
jgi:hypothetical protein